MEIDISYPFCHLASLEFYLTSILLSTYYVPGALLEAGQESSFWLHGEANQENNVIVQWEMMGPEPWKSMRRDNFERKWGKGVLKGIPELKVTEFDKFVYLERKRR